MKEHNGIHYNFQMPPIKKFNIFLLGLAVAALQSLGGCASTLKVSSQEMLSRVEVATAVSVRQALPEHERLVFRVKWMGITAGELVAEIRGKVDWKGRSCYLLEVTGRTSGFISTFYRVDDHYRSYFDAENLYSLRYEEHRHEGSYHKDAVTDFDHQAGKAYFKNAADGTEKTFDIPAGVQDSLTAAYMGRLLPLVPGKMFTFKVCNSEKVYDLYVSTGGRSQLNHRAVLHLIPFAKINGDEFREGRASGYVTDDERKLPLEVVIKAPVFTSVTAKLVE
jgi:hypothetical protein